MSELDALLAGIVADGGNPLRWLVLADWLDDHNQPERAELVRVHRELLRTCTATRETKARKQLHSRMMELMRAGVQPCLPQRTLVLPGGVVLRMSFIPPGSFLMGSPKSEEGHDRDEKRHLVTLTKGFWLGQTPVTQRQWVGLMGQNPSHFKGDELPVDRVRWDDTWAFCTTLKQQTGNESRLPTEAEWEYAARSGTTTPFYWGTRLSRECANFDGENRFGWRERGPAFETTLPVGSYSKVAPHPWGLVDVSGNVSEWCSDGYAVDLSSLETDPIGVENGFSRVVRGGSWAFSAWDCRAASRGWRDQDYCDDSLGFRIAVSPSAEK